MKYAELVGLYEKLGGTTKRLEKTYFVSEFLKKVDIDDLQQIILLLQGRIYPAWDEREIGVASQMMAKAISAATGHSKEAINREWKRTGDLGDVAESLTKKKRQSTLFSGELTVKKVFENIRKLTEMEGAGSVDRKIRLIAELLTSAKPKEALYITRTILQDLRVGVGSGAMRDAIAWAYFPKVVGIFLHCAKCHKYVPASSKCIECRHELKKKFSEEIKGFKAKNVLEIKSADELKNLEKYDFVLAEEEKIARAAYNKILDSVQQAYDLSNDFAEVAKKAKLHGLKGLCGVSLKIGVPVKVMLALKVDSINEGFDAVGQPADFEFKLDGFRIQVHKDGKGVQLFTRRLDDVTKQFPDVVDYVKKHVKANFVILDSEAVGFDPKTERYKPFQRISQRIKRKYEIDKMTKELPVELNVFDVISYNGKNMIDEPFKERRKVIEKIIKPAKRKIVVVKNLVTDDEKKAEEFYKESLRAGNEGVMIKKLDAPYKPGARVGFMLKYKPVAEPLDLVIVGAEWGEGKRAKWLSSFTLACRRGDDFVEMGKVGTGIKEKAGEGVSFKELTKLLKPLITKEKGRSVDVKPEIMVEVAYGEIQKSPTYSSGYALRFPRVIRLRHMERGPHDAVTLKYVKYLYEKQKKRK